jgi:hypothetical protein
MVYGGLPPLFSRKKLVLIIELWELASKFMKILKNEIKTKKSDLH